MQATLMQTNAFVTSYKSKEAAEAIVATFADDADFSAKIVTRKDGRFVVVVTNNETGEELPL